MGSVRVLLAPGPIGTVPALAAARAMAEAWRERTGDVVAELAMSDGSEGVLDVVAAARGGSLTAVPVRGPLGAVVPATVLVVDGTAHVDAGQAVGRHLVPGADAAVARARGTSAGVGEILAAALQEPVTRLVVALPPAAVRDGGSGALGALGGTTEDPEDLAAGPEWAGRALARVGDALAGRDLVVACAEDGPLLGARLEPGDDGLEAFAGVLAAAARPRGRALLDLAGGPAAEALSPRRPRTGAGGGLGFLLAALGGRLLDGAEVVAAAVGLDAVAAADLVVTAATRLDADELDRGVVAVVARAGRAHGVPVVVLAGEVEVSRRELAAAGVAGAYPLRPAPGPYAAADAGPLGLDALARRVHRVAATWSPRR